MNKLMVFESNKVEVFEFKSQVLFNPKDVAECLGISDVNSSIRSFNDNQVVKLTNSDMHDMQFRKLNNRGENFLTEAGVYKLIFKSKKDNAEKFQDWVTDEVLPSIRKNGAYITDNVIDIIYNDPQAMIDLLTKLKDEKYARVEAERRNNILMHIHKTYTVTEIAKELGFRSAIALNKDLCNKGMQYKVNNTYVLYSEYASLGYVSIKQQILDNGKVIYNRHFTQDGRKFILDLYKTEKQAN